MDLSDSTTRDLLARCARNQASRPCNFVRQTGEVAITTRGQNLRSSTPGQTPAAGTRQPGELWLNFPDLQLGAIDTSRNAQKLIAVRFFSTLANYVAGDFVIQGGKLYFAKGAVPVGAFNAGQWSQVAALTDIPALYVLPTASTSVLGGVKIDGTSITISSGVISSAGLVSVGATPPSPVQNGALWYDLVGGQLYAWVDDGTSKQWVIAVNQNLAGGVWMPLTGGVFSGAISGPSAAFANLSAPQAIGDNRIINGDMRIDQRNGGAAGTANNVYTVDRWAYTASQTGKGTWQRNYGPPGSLAPGFPYCLGFASSSAYALLAGDYFQLGQPIEADMVSDFAWGTSSAQPVTLSFWAMSSLTGTFSGSVCNGAGSRSYPFNFQISSVNAWTKITLTIPGDTAGTWVMSGNAVSMYVRFDLGSGASQRAPANAWAAGNYVGATGAVSVISTNGAYFFITGVKLEIGSVATPFNRQSLAKSQADCERYFRWLPFNMRFMATAGSFLAQSVSFLAMRAAPTIGGLVADPNTSPSSANNSGYGFSAITPYSACPQLTPGAVGDCYVFGYRAPASAEL